METPAPPSALPQGWYITHFECCPGGWTITRTREMTWVCDRFSSQSPGRPAARAGSGPSSTGKVLCWWSPADDQLVAVVLPRDIAVRLLTIAGLGSFGGPEVLLLPFAPFRLLQDDNLFTLN